MPCGATQDGRVMVESSDKMWSNGEGNDKSVQYSCLENPMNAMKRQKDRTLKDEFPRLVGTQYATGDQWRNNSRKNGESEKVKVKSLSCVRLFATPWTVLPARLLCPWDFPGKSTGVACHFLLQRIFSNWVSRIIGRRFTI